MPRNRNDVSSNSCDNVNPMDFLPIDDNFHRRHRGRKYLTHAVCNCLTMSAYILIIMTLCLHILAFINDDTNDIGLSGLFPAQFRPTPDRPNAARAAEVSPEAVTKNFDKVDTSENFEIEDKLTDLEMKLKKLARTMENATKTWLKLEKRFKKLTKENTSTFTITDLTTNVIDEKIEAALNRYDADKNGQMDYALESAGATIISTPFTNPYPSKIAYQFLGFITLHYPSSPRAIIQAGILPGECFAFHGSQGRVRIKLAAKIIISAVSLEHSSIPEDKSSAPNGFEIIGFDSAYDSNGVILGRFCYDIHGKPLQTFKVDQDTSGFQFVELAVLSNHGHEEYTCIYRFRVHGKLWP